MKLSPTTAVPERTCVGCRQRTGVANLIRVVVVEDVLVPDPARRLPGRGAYLHRNGDCLALAERRRAWSRAFKLAGAPDSAQLGAWVKDVDR